jgi:hypothetical protein
MEEPAFEAGSFLVFIRIGADEAFTEFLFSIRILPSHENPPLSPNVHQFIPL